MQTLKCQLVMLQYDYKKAPIDEMIFAINTETNKLVFSYLSNLSHTEKPIHFYLVSDREIFVDDKVINISSHRMWSATESDVDFLNKNIHSTRRIEATTDKSLGLPLIPPTFPGKYISKVFDVTQVNINMIQLLGDVDMSQSRDYPKMKQTVETRANGTVILSKVNPKFTYEDMLKAFHYGRASRTPSSNVFGQTGEEFLDIYFDFKVPQE